MKNEIEKSSFILKIKNLEYSKKNANTVKYEVPWIDPLFLPFGSVNTTPAHLPGANVVIPMYATSPRIFLPATSTL